MSEKPGPRSDAGWRKKGDVCLAHGTVTVRGQSMTERLPGEGQKWIRHVGS